MIDVAWWIVANRKVTTLFVLWKLTALPHHTTFVYKYYLFIYNTLCFQLHYFDDVSAISGCIFM